MTLQEFHEHLNTQDIEDKIVYMRYKYSWEDEWTYTNEILEVDMSVDEYYIWVNDWNEGQEEVEILGCISVSDIDVPEFEIPRKSTSEQESVIDKMRAEIEKWHKEGTNWSDIRLMEIEDILNKYKAESEGKE